jgi:hypothetical protein
MAKKSAAAPRKTKPGFIEHAHAAIGKTGHPHLDPINAATFASDRDLALAKVSGLMAYQKFLADARTAKARRKGSTSAFERNVQAQGRQALADLQAFSGAVLRITQQMNQTDVWRRTLDHMSTALGSSGPVSAQQIWNELQANEQYKSTLQAHGVTDEMAASATEAISKLDARLVLQGGKVLVETRVAGESQPRRLSLKASLGRPTGIVDLLRRSQFEQVVSAFTRSDPAYVEAVSAGRALDCEPGDLFAYGAVAARQRVAEHVRKLEDTGLATYQGNEPFTVLVAALAIGLFLGLVGSIILYLCDHPGDVSPPDWVCATGFVLVMIAVVVLGALTGIAIVEGVALLAVAGIALGALLPEWLRHFQDFSPGMAAPA